VVIAWAAHLYTATGAVLAFVAARAIIGGDVRAAFLALAAAAVIDATDGWLARAVRVKQRLPAFDGARLDDIVDYLTYVFVPVLIIWRLRLVPEGLDVWVAAAVLLASAFGFSHAHAKVQTTDHFFTGFPSYWNIVALYLVGLGLRPSVNAAILLVLSGLVFVPVRYVYPSRTRQLRGVTLALGAVWAMLMAAAIWRLPATGGPWLPLSLVFVVYYFALSLWLHARPGSSRDRTLPP
jgi:phosphatidylcholine synthase